MGTAPRSEDSFRKFTDVFLQNNTLGAEHGSAELFHFGSIRWHGGFLRVHCNDVLWQNLPRAKP